MTAAPAARPIHDQMIAKLSNLSAEYVRSILHYDPATGVFTWRWRADRSPQWNGRWAGKRAGYDHDGGYCRIRINGHAYLGHRLAFLYMTGEWPAGQVDHKNCIRGDDRWGNLRTATHGQNQQNAGPPANNRSGYKGVSWNMREQKWRAGIGCNGERIHLGTFDSAEAAAAAYAEAAREHFGEYARAA